MSNKFGECLNSSGWIVYGKGELFHWAETIAGFVLNSRHKGIRMKRNFVCLEGFFGEFACQWRIYGRNTCRDGNHRHRFADDFIGVELEFLRPGLPLVVVGQFSYVVSIATLMIAARLKRFDTTLEEAALNLGASRAGVLRTITLPYLQPALVGAGAIAFLMSFENFNTTLMLVGSDPPLTVMMYGRMREGASPVLNAVSLFLMIASALLALALLQRPDARQD